MFKKLYARRLIKRLNNNFSNLTILNRNVELFESCIENLYRKFPMEYYHSIYELKKSEEIRYYEEIEIDFESSEDQQYKFFSLKDVNYISIDKNYYPIGETKDLILEMFAHEKMIEEFLDDVEELNVCYEGDMTELERIDVESFKDRSEVFSNYENTVNEIFDRAENVCYNIINKMLQEIINSSKEIVNKGERIDI